MAGVLQFPFFAPFADEAVHGVLIEADLYGCGQYVFMSKYPAVLRRYLGFPVTGAPAVPMSLLPANI